MITKWQSEVETRREDHRHDREHMKRAVNESKHEMSKMVLRVASIEKKLEVAHDQLRVQVQKCEAAREKAKTMVPAESVAAVQLQLDVMHELHRQRDEEIDELQHELSTARAKLDDLTKGPGSGRRHDANAAAYLATLTCEIGLDPGRVSVPPRSSESKASQRRSVTHMAVVISGRGEGDDIDLVADALERCGYLEKLVEAPRFQSEVKRIVEDAVGKVQSHWSARHAVHVWDRLELSRSQMETLSHLLSFVYNPATDKYDPITVWKNPTDSTDFVLTARLAGRKAREKKLDEIASTMGITVGSNGRCERDATECTSLLYSTYANALRAEYSSERPAQPVLFLDGTGSGLGKGICHGEIGCADFIAVGDSDARQSRATLQPLFLYEGNDHSEDLRSNLDLAIKSYNKLVDAGTFERTIERNGIMVTESIPARCLTAADMQGAKATYGMKSQSHSVWCKCQKGEGGPQHKYPTTAVESYEEMLAYITSVGCEIKTYDELCSWAHYSPGVARGGRFTTFTCSCCGYSPSQRQWERDMAKWNAMDDDAREAAQREHYGEGDELNSTKHHFHQLLYHPPLPHHGMERCGVDDLHLTHLNFFKHLFKYTVHEGLPESKKKLVAAYTKKAGFYSYDATSIDEDPVSHWIGREVKRFIMEAYIHLPFLLRIAAAPPDLIPELAASLNVAGEMEMEDDDEYAPTPEEIAQEEEEEPLMMKNADRWQRFLDLVAARGKPWPQGASDTDTYRQQRAVESFNLGAACANDLIELKPTLQSWVPHILVFIDSRQMVELGDPKRRSCDACESFGAMVKKIIKHLTCRRRLRDQPTEHEGRRLAGGANGKKWRQTLTRGFIEQAFRRATVRESLRHGKENEPFLMREDHRRMTTGKTHFEPKKFGADSTPLSLRAAMEAAEPQ